MFIAGLAPESRVNGPGRRVVLWVQGCTLACPGCFNPGTHGAGGESLSAAEVARQILEARTARSAGVTFSGGEPFEQDEALTEVAGLVREAWPEVTFMAFTGYRYEEVAGSPLLGELDWLVDGRYDARRRAHRPWRASTNQRLWSLRAPLPPGCLGSAPDAELVVTREGDVVLSGFPDARLRRAVAKL